MSVTTKIELNLKGLDDLRRQAGDSYRARVGILSGPNGKAGEKHANGIDNVTLGVIQMFGSATNHIPPRDFLVMPIRMNATEIVKQMKGAQVSKAIMAQDFKQVYKLLGAAALSWILKAFETRGFGQWAPNKPSTIDRKGSSMPLIDTSQLRRSITSDVVGKSGV